MTHFGSRIEYNVSPEISEIISAIFTELDVQTYKTKNINPSQEEEPKMTESLSSKAQRIYKARRKTDEIANLRDFSASPAFDCLLDLYVNAAAGRRVSVTSASIGAACALTTALRWIRHLEEQQLIERSADPHDQRRAYIALTEKGTALIEEALAFY